MSSIALDQLGSTLEVTNLINNSRYEILKNKFVWEVESMLLSSVTIKNIKSYYPEEKIDFDPKDRINIYVGPNSSGKSNLFEILQGLINNIFYKHLIVEPNSERSNKAASTYGINYKIRADNFDINNYKNNIVDKHFEHTAEPSLIRLCWKITASDITSVKSIVSAKDKIIQFTHEKVVDEFGLDSATASLNSDADFSFLKNREIAIDFTGANSELTIANISDFPADTHVDLQNFVTIIRHVNAFYEFSSIFPHLKLSPQSRYFGPHRDTGPINPDSNISLSDASNFEDSYSKGVNLTRDNGGNASTHLAPTRLAALHNAKRQSVINHYNEYLSKYLNVKSEIKKVDIPYKTEYQIKFTRSSGVPLKLSSGEREFFNLISGLILSQIKNGIVFIDEPEIHLHFKWQEVIIDLIRTLGKQYNLQFLIVTHSPKFISPATARYINHVSMQDGCTKITQLDRATLSSSKTRDLLTFLSTTNNEKAFFSDKVVLVEGLSDLLVYSHILNNLKKQFNNSQEIEILPALSKNNLYNFKTILQAWHIPCFIIGDFDFISEVLNAYSKDHPKNKEKVTELKNEVKKLIPVSKQKLKKILTEESDDGKAFVDILLSKDTVPAADFLESMDRLLNYLKAERAIKAQKDVVIPENLNEFINERYEAENVYILKKGALENYFKHYKSNKIDNASEITQIIQPPYNDELVGIFTHILKS